MYSQNCPCTTSCLMNILYQNQSPWTIDFGYYYDPNCASAITFLWEFGDGNTSTEEFPTHTYQTLGTYTVHLQIVDINGCCSEYSIVIGCPPVNVLCEPLCSGFVIDQGFENFTDPSCGDPNFLSQFANNCIENWYPANGTADVLSITGNEPGYEGTYYARFVENEAVYTPFNIRK
ncbi:MAG: PKD domain-containing protein [Saprospiraceae bacterium]|nr:PKD domain-containing protein [Saprospiraceae bacterium]